RKSPAIGSSSEKNPAGVSRQSAMSPNSISADAQILRRFLALVRDDIERDLVALSQVAQARFLDRRDMDEHVLPAVVRLNEAVALRCVEPLYCTARHVRSPWK